MPKITKVDDVYGKYILDIDQIVDRTPQIFGMMSILSKFY